MKTVVVEDGNSIVCSRGGGFLAAVGLPLLAIGILFLAVPLAGEKALGVSGFVMLKNGAFLALAGLALAFGRRRVRVDRANGLLIRSWVLFVPLATTRRPLADFRSVTVSEREAGRPGGMRSIRLFAPSLADREGRETPILYTPSAAEAAEHAARLALFLGLPRP